MFQSEWLVLMLVTKLTPAMADEKENNCVSKCKIRLILNLDALRANLQKNPLPLCYSSS